MVRRWSSLLLVMMFVLAGMAVMVSAQCPNQPSDCRPSGGTVPITIGSARLDVSAYKDEVQAQTAHTTAYADSSNEYTDGDSGGILVIVKELSDAETFTITFPENPSGLHWTGPTKNVLTINNPTVDGYYLLPFEVTTPNLNLDLSFTVQDNLGNSKSGTLVFEPIAEAIGGQPISQIPAWVITVAIFGLVAILMVIPRFRK